MIDYREFFAKVVAHEPGRENQRAAQPILGIDECANHRALREAAGQACREGLLDRYVDLWYQLRRREDGSHIQLVGKVHREAFPAGFDLGRPVKGHSWPDELVVQLLIAQFGASDRVILTSENTRNDHSGVRRIINEQVKPILESGSYAKLGLLIFMKHGKTSWPKYADALLRRIRLGVQPGYEYTCN